MIDHPLVPRDAAKLIIEQDSLDALIGDLRAAGSFAYDTEFIGELTYHPLLCLIQVATTDRVTLIDPMVDLDLRQFWELLADKSVEKIVHAGQQDVEPVARHLGSGRRAHNVVDTQICAGFVGMAYPVALSKLVLEVLGAKLGKGLTFTDWDNRPLSAVQMRYAADDVRYLPALWDELRSRLDAIGHREWAQAECDEMCDPAQFGFNPQTCYLRLRGAGSLSNSGLAVLRELTIWRDRAARDQNVPARALVKDDILVNLARSPVKHVDKLERVRGLPRPVEVQHGKAIVEATQRALTSPDAHHRLEHGHEPTPTERFRADALYATTCAMCAAKSLDPALATSRQEVGELLHRVSKKKPLDDLHVMTSWRRQAVGEPLLAFMEGRAPHEKFDFIWRDGLSAPEP